MTYIGNFQEHLRESIARERPIRFAYLKQGFALPEYRTMSVFELSEDGETFLGFDHGRQELRRFDITRVVGELRFADDEDYVYPIGKEA